VKAATIGIRTLADYSVGLKDRQHRVCPELRREASRADRW
jgi:hypothetical protein